MLDQNTKVKQLIAHPEIVVVLDKHINGFSTNKQLRLAYGMSLAQIIKFCGLDEDGIESLYAEIAALNIPD